MNKKLFNSNKRLFNSNRSQGEIITTILLILLSIAALTIVISFVMPLIQNQMAGSDCVNMINQIQITNNLQYTCYNPSAKTLSVQIHVGDLQEKSSSFLISVSVEGSSNNYKVNSTGIDAGASVLGGTNFPGKDQERTYVITNINSKPNLINVYPILNNGKTCDPSSSYKSLELC